MQKCVIVKCPMALTLFLNIETIEPNIKAKLIKQTVAMKDTLECDTLEIENISSMSEKVKIECSNISINEKEKINKTISLFEEITNLKLTKLNIKIKRENLRLSYLSFSSIIAGLLIGLNEYYHTNIEISKLKKIGSQIDPLVPYFIVGGFKRIIESKGEIDKLTKNPYQSYLLVDNNEDLILPNLSEIKKYGIVSKNFENNLPYSDYSKLSGNEYSDIKDYLKNYEEIVSSLMGDTSLYLITSKNSLLLSRINYKLKHEFPKYKIYSVSNTERHRVLVKFS